MKYNYSKSPVFSRLEYKNCPKKLTDNSQNSSITHLIVEECLPLLLDVLSSPPEFIPEKKVRRQKLLKRAEELMRDCLHKW